MKGTKTFVMAQLIGLKSLPHESGAWGILLPRGKDPATHEPDARDQVQEINPAFMTFIDSEMNVDPGMWLVMGIFVSSCMFAGSVLLGPRLATSGAPLGVLAVVFGVYLIATLWPAIAVFKLVTKPLRPPVILSRKSRQIYVWRGMKLGWRALNYDDVHPFIFRAQMISTVGAATIYTVQAAVIDANRTIVDSVVVAPPARSPSACGMNWEFIRRYMDGTPEEVPPVLSQPPVNDKRAILARMDQIGFSGLVGRDFHLEPSIFAWCYYYFYGFIGYWWFRAAAWLQCRGRYPEYSKSITQAMTFEGPNPYRKEPLSATEQAAFEGKLPRLKIRWAILGTLSTLLWGAAWLALVLGLAMSL
ncbi:hypothetical protein C7414_105250 [Cupriavidus alkaliphilus]|nr:hypothetical protein C7414_105250 [Cupriavidus alkaliphilus]